MKMSWSRRRMYSECPAKFGLEYVAKVPRLRPVEPLEFGSVAHRGLAELLLAKGTTPEDAMEEVWSGRSNVIGDDRRGELVSILENGHRDAEKGWDTLVGVELKWVYDRDGKPLDVEFDDPEAFIRLAVDRLDMLDPVTAKITDWKTSFQVTKDMGQLKLYAWAAFQRNPQLETVETELRFVRYRNAKESGSFTRDELKGVLAEYVKISDEIDAKAAPVPMGALNELEPEWVETWPATPGEGCSTCSYDCPLVVEDFFGIPPVQDQETAERLLGETVALKRQVELRTKAVKAWADEYGTITAAGQEAGHFPSVKVIASLEDLRLVAQDNEGVIWDYVSPLTASQFAKLADKGDATAEEILERHTKAPTRWSVKKAAKPVVA